MSAERVLVTGGSGGIGAATAELLARRGFRPVIGHARNRAAAEEVAARCDGTPLALDLSRPESIDRAVTALADEPTPLAGVVLAAALPPRLERFGQIEDAALATQLQVAAIGNRRLLAGVVGGLLRPRRRGTIVGVLSEAMGGPERPAMASMGAYVIAKHALGGVLALLAVDYPWLQVHTVSPGFTETRMLETFDSRFVESLREQGRVASAEQVAMDICAHFEPASDGDR